MKIVLSKVVILFIGLAIGWFFTKSYYTNLIVPLMVTELESMNQIDNSILDHIRNDEADEAKKILLLKIERGNSSLNYYKGELPKN